jgi:hypothetical protein
MKSTRRFLGIAVSVFATAWAAPRIEAQINAPSGAGETGALVEAPAYQVLRFEEDWSRLASGGTGDAWDAMKYIPLGGPGDSFLSIGGQIRLRTEAVSNFNLVEDADRDDVFGLTRVMLHGDLRISRHLRVFAEGRHSVAHGRELPGGRRPLDHDHLALQNGFVQVGGTPGGTPLSVRVGRQELLIGSQRLVSPLDWTNTRRTFDGVRFQAGDARLGGQGFLTRPVIVRQGSFNRADSLTTFAGAVLSRTLTPRSTWSTYLLHLDQDERASFAGVQGAHRRTTLGGRLLTGDPTRVRADVELGVQGGELAGRDIRAWFFASDFSRGFANLPFRPTATIGFDWASGNEASSEAIGTFHQLFPLGHAYAGYTDVLGRQNLIENRVVLAGTVGPDIQVRAAGHLFNRASRSDAAYTVGGAILEPAGADPARGIGREVNLTAMHRFGRHLRMEAGYGRFTPGEFLAARAAGAHPMDWVYLSTAYTF